MGVREEEGRWEGAEVDEGKETLRSSSLHDMQRRLRAPLPSKGIAKVGDRA